MYQQPYYYPGMMRNAPVQDQRFLGFGLLPFVTGLALGPLLAYPFLNRPCYPPPPPPLPFPYYPPVVPPYGSYVGGYPGVGTGFGAGAGTAVTPTAPTSFPITTENVNIYTQ